MFLGREELAGFRAPGRDDDGARARARRCRASSVTTIRSVRQTVAGLSGGQRQSVAVAKAVMWNSKLVILDEPTAALGVAQTRQVLDLVKRLGDQGLAVVLISHNLHDIFEVADSHHGPAPRPERRRVQDASDVTQTQVVEAITAGKLSQGPRPAGGGDRMSATRPRHSAGPDEPPPMRRQRATPATSPSGEPTSRALVGRASAAATSARCRSSSA